MCEREEKRVRVCEKMEEGEKEGKGGRDVRVCMNYHNYNVLQKFQKCGMP